MSVADKTIVMSIKPELGESQQSVDVEEDSSHHPWQCVNDLIRNYNDAIIMETELLYQTTFDRISANIRVGFSIARGLLPTVIVTSNSNSSRISFTREEWMDLSCILPSSTTATICATEAVMTIRENFTVRLGSCSSVGYIHSRGQTVYLHDKFLQEIAGLKDLINYRLELLETLDLKNFYSNLLSNVAMLECLDNNIPVHNLIKNVLLGFKYSQQVFCIMEYLDSHCNNIIEDFNKMRYM